MISKASLKIGWFVLFGLALVTFVIIEHQVLHGTSKENDWLTIKNLEHKLLKTGIQHRETQKDLRGELWRRSEELADTKRKLEIASAKISFLKKTQQDPLDEKQGEIYALRKQVDMLKMTNDESSPALNTVLSEKEKELSTIKKYLADLEKENGAVHIIKSKKSYQIQLHNTCSGAKLLPRSYPSSISAVAACDANPDCYGFYDQNCDGIPPFYICQDQSTWKLSSGSCIREKPGSWEFYSGTFLAKYTSKKETHEYETLSKAQHACVNFFPDCGGITKITQNKWELRVGSRPQKSDIKESSWIRPTKEKDTEQIEILLDNNIYDRSYILQHMAYWKVIHPSKLPNPFDKYLTFTIDCGGFNNIRMSFEYMVVIAWLTRRTLVMPPPQAWYLIDWGPFTRMQPEESSARVSTFHDFFDLDDLKAAVPIITTAEFIKRESDRLAIPEEFRHSNPIRDHKSWENWLISLKVHQRWGNLKFVLYWPDINSLDDIDKGKLRDLIDGRKPAEYTHQTKQLRIIHFPSCHKDEGDYMEWRYLGQVAAIAAYDDPELARSMKRMLRDHVHYIPMVFEIASKVVSVLGMWNFSSIHVRRNDLQYKEVFVSAQETLDNIRALLNPGEPIYLATDETSPEFFAIIEKEFPLYRWQDFFSQKGNNVLADIEIKAKLEGCIEQVICAMGRRFFGTKESTFSSYIVRLRGYVNAPDKNIYFHNKHYSGILSEDSRHFPRIHGTKYKSEDPSMWEDI